MASDSAQLRTEAQQYLNLPEAELYAMLVSEEEREGRAFSRGGLVARGKEIFQDVWRDVSDTVCGYYAKREKTIDSQVDVVALVATPLLGHPAVAGIGVVALSALIVKIGLGTLCPAGKASDA